MSGNYYEMPGVSLADGYVVPGAPGEDEALTYALGETGQALAERTEREAALPPDPALVGARNAIRAEYAAAADAWAARKRAHYADPARARYKPEGLTALDTEFETVLAADQAALRDKLGRRLDVVERAVVGRLDAANAVPVGRDEDDAAMRFAAMLSHTTPRHGAGLLADFVRDATEDPGLAYAALPLLRSAHDRGEWKGDYELARTVETLQRVVEASPGRARAQADLALVAETRRQLGHLGEAAASAPADRFVMNGLGEDVPVAGRPGFGLEWSASPDAVAMFGEGPTLSGDEPVRESRQAPSGAPRPAEPVRRISAKTDKQRAADEAALAANAG